MSESHTPPLRLDHVATHGAQRVGDVRAECDATVIPDGYEALGHRALAARLGCCPRSARYLLERLAATQTRADVLRVVKLPVAIGSGAVRPALHVLWPRPKIPEAVGRNPPSPPAEHAPSA